MKHLHVFLSFLIILSVGVAWAARPETTREGEAMRISVRAGDRTVVYELNDSPAARGLWAQLPLTARVEDYGDKEKIFYPPAKLPTANTPAANADRGSLAYYAPWGNVVMFHVPFGRGAGLYELGHAVSGQEHVRRLSGTITVAREGE